MGVIYKGIGSNLKGIIKHGLPGEAPIGPTVEYFGTYEEGTNIVSEGLAGYFSDEFSDYVLVSGDTGSLTFDPVTCSVSGTIANIATYSFVVTASNEGGPSETITFEYQVVPLHGLENDYVISPDGQTASFAPYFNIDDGIRFTSTSVGFSTNEDQAAYVSEQLVTDSRDASEYGWTGDLTGTGLSINATGLIDGTIAIGFSNDGTYGPFDLTVTSPFGDTATLTVEIEFTFFS